MNALLWLLAVLGALGGISLVWTWGCKKIHNYQEWRKLRNGLADFRYDELEICARISDSGATWKTLRRARVTSLVESLESIRVGVLPRNEITHACRVEPAGFILKDIASPTSRFHLMHVEFKVPLKKGESSEFFFYCDFTKTPPAEDHLTWISATKVDILKLRVVFDGITPRQVGKKVEDISDRELLNEKLALDPMSFESKLESLAPRSNLNYSIFWQY